jgi:hypothetical protein
LDSEELLAQLADIHLPAEITSWPPAPGWWILALIVLVLVVLAIRRYIRHRNLHQICQHALAELSRCYNSYANEASGGGDDLKLKYVNEFNSVIRRVALYHFPQPNVASLSGRAWVDFIREKGESSRLDDSIAAALSFGRFQTECDVDVDALNNLGEEWITSLYLGDPNSTKESLNPTASDISGVDQVTNA